MYGERKGAVDAGQVGSIINLMLNIQSITMVSHNHDFQLITIAVFAVK